MNIKAEIAARNRTAHAFVLFFAFVPGLYALMYRGDGERPENTLFRWFGCIGIWLTAERLAPLAIRLIWPDSASRPDLA